LIYDPFFYSIVKNCELFPIVLIMRFIFSLLLDL
jgi:hypothetical protein